MTIKRIQSTSWFEVAVAISLYALVILALYYTIIFSPDKSDETLEFLRLVEAMEEIKGKEPPIQVANPNALDPSNFDYREWVGMESLLSLNK